MELQVLLAMGGLDRLSVPLLCLHLSLRELPRTQPQTKEFLGHDRFSASPPLGFKFWLGQEMSFQRKSVLRTSPEKNGLKLLDQPTGNAVTVTP
eukprot:478845-Pelagomonas_calceolata.AAC.1